MLVSRIYGLVVGGCVVQSTVRMEVEMGPPPPAPGGGDWRLLPTHPEWSAPPGARLRWVNFGAMPEWEAPPLDGLREAAINAIDAAGEALRLAVINRMPTQTEEYRQALTQAQSWKAAGYPETEESPAPADVTSWAMARWRDGWTARQAADDILSTASAWTAILSKIRLLRLLNKQDVLHAATPEEVAAISADMAADMQAMAQSLGLSLT